MPLETSQIVFIERFTAVYYRGSNGISTPSDNTFLNCDRERIDLNAALLQNDFILLTGVPGIGKTKLALEGINSFLSQNLTFGAYCVSNKNHTLLDDLFQYFDSNNGIMAPTVWQKRA